jgi:hypothetical protein
MKKCGATKSCVVNIGTLPGLNSKVDGALYIQLGEAILVPDKEVVTAKYLKEAPLTNKDQGFINKGVYHLTAEQAS